MRSNLRTEPQRDGSAVYVTQDGDMVDQIAFAYYGSHVGTTELLYEANPHLTARTLRLTAGVRVVLPVFRPAAASSTRIKLWD